LNPAVPNVARIYDYLLGGKDHFAADREAAGQLITAIPDVATFARQNRDFLGRVVRFLSGDAGIRQFIDIGTGLPTQGSVHEVAHEADPSARVVYVDHDPVVLTHARELLATHKRNVAAISGDLRHPERILADPGLRALITADEPVAVLLIAVMHFLPDDDQPATITDTLMAALPPGSYLALSHITAENIPEDANTRAKAVYDGATARPYPRTHAEVTRMFNALDLVEPGVVDVAGWRALPPVGRTLAYGGVARKAR
jgi:O-methyltransferase involved in polyketide biosynthesis